MSLLPLICSFFYIKVNFTKRNIKYKITLTRCHKCVYLAKNKITPKKMKIKSNRISNVSFCYKMKAKKEVLEHFKSPK